MLDHVLTVTLNPALDLTLQLENFAVGELNKSKSILWNVGGKGINVATCLSDYGVPVSVTGILGERNCELFDEHFNSRKIPNLFVRHSGANRINMKIADIAKQETTDVNSQGDAVGSSELSRVEAAIFENEASWIVISGSLPPGIENSVYAKLIPIAKQVGAQVILDTAGEPLRLAISTKPFLIKPNLIELETYVSKKLISVREVRDVARRLVDQGVEKVVVSLGKDGALFVDAKECWQAEALPVSIVSTVGAGDAMVAGLVSGLREKRSWADCARLGVAFATGKLEKVGPQLPSKKKIEELFAKVKLSSV